MEVWAWVLEEPGGLGVSSEIIFYSNIKTCRDRSILTSTSIRDEINLASAERLNYCGALNSVTFTIVICMFSFIDFDFETERFRDYF